MMIPLSNPNALERPELPLLAKEPVMQIQTPKPPVVRVKPLGTVHYGAPKAFPTVIPPTSERPEPIQLLQAQHQIKLLHKTKKHQKHYPTSTSMKPIAAKLHSHAKQQISYSSFSHDAPRLPLKSYFKESPNIKTFVDSALNLNTNEYVPAKASRSESLRQVQRA